MVEEIMTLFFILFWGFFVGMPLTVLGAMAVRMLMRPAISSRCGRGRHASAGMFGCNGRGYGRTCSCGCHAPIP